MNEQDVITNATSKLLGINYVVVSPHSNIKGADRPILTARVF